MNERIVKSGGRGYILGDFGSGYQFGRDALIHYLDDPSACSPALRRAVSELFRTEDDSEIIASVYRSQTPAGILAKLAKPIGDLNLSVRARKCMTKLGIQTVGELLSHTGDELLECKNFGVTSLNEVKEKLTALGLKLRGD